MKLIANKHSELLQPQIDLKLFAELRKQEKEVEVKLGRVWTGDKTNLLTNKFCANFLACCLKQKKKTVLGTKGKQPKFKNKQKTMKKKPVYSQPFKSCDVWFTKKRKLQIKLKFIITVV